MYKKMFALILLFSVLTLTLSVLPIHGEGQIYESVLRLHVLANSDSEEDQALKLKVRDAVLLEAGEMFESCRSREDAETAVRENISIIQQISEETVAKLGYDYPISIVLGEEEYPERNYESCCFPSGEYLSLRIMIGNAAGKNWWCVLYPPMCLGAATDGGSGYVEAGLTDGQYRMITQTDKPKYKARFKLLEAIEGAVR